MDPLSFASFEDTSQADWERYNRILADVLAFRDSETTGKMIHDVDAGIFVHDLDKCSQWLHLNTSLCCFGRATTLPPQASQIVQWCAKCIVESYTSDVKCTATGLHPFRFIDRPLLLYLDRKVHEHVVSDWAFPMRITQMLTTFFDFQHSIRIRIHLQAYCALDQYPADDKLDLRESDNAYIPIEYGIASLHTWVHRSDYHQPPVYGFSDLLPKLTDLPALAPSLATFADYEGTTVTVTLMVAQTVPSLDSEQSFFDWLCFATIVCYGCQGKTFPDDILRTLRYCAQQVFSCYSNHAHDWDNDEHRRVDRYLLAYLGFIVKDECAPGVPWCFPLRITRLLLMFFSLPHPAKDRILYQASLVVLGQYGFSPTPTDAFIKYPVADEHYHFEILYKRPPS